MEDPFSSLLKSLQSVFHLEAMRNGKYTVLPVQQLKDAIERYKPQANYTFITLLRALREALPYIEKWRVDFDMIRKSMDELAKIHGLPRIDWNKVLAHPKVSPKFQFSALNHATAEADLMVWLTAKTGKPLAQLSHTDLAQAMVDYREHHGFSQKLNAHLKKEPDFLFNLILTSQINFIKIAKTRLILYLNDEQLALAIIKHIPTLVHKQKEPFERVEQLVHTLNQILSNGRSVPTLFRNAEARAILNKSLFFQIYNSEEYLNRHNPQNKNNGPKNTF